MIQIVLYQPEIPFNTANIGRTCYLTNTKLHLIKPLGFSLEDKHLRRVGLDYWTELELTVHNSLEDFLEYAKDSKIFLASTKAAKSYSEVSYSANDFIFFGRESEGVKRIKDQSRFEKIRIPMRKDSDRSLNLSNSASIILFEALRQNNFFDLI